MLLYGLEIIQLNKHQIEQPELYQKKLVKQILSVPTNTHNAAVYILSGFLPNEAQLDKKILTFFTIVCHQSDNSIDKRLAVRQTTVKSLKSNSWFIGVKRVLLKYYLGNIENLIVDLPPKLRWKSRINRAVDDHWKDILINQATLYKTLRDFNLNEYQPGVVHKLLRTEPLSARDVNRIPTQLRLLYGAYILQSNISAYNQTAVNPMCELLFTYLR